MTEATKLEKRTAVIRAVQTPLGFFSLAVLVLESVVGVVTVRSEGFWAWVYVVGMIALIMALIGMVGFMAFFRPESLYGPHPGAGGVSQNGTARAGILAAVDTPLGFFVLVVLVVEVIFGGIALVHEGTTRATAVIGMLGLLAALAGVVALLAFFRPKSLRGADR